MEHIPTLPYNKNPFSKSDLHSSTPFYSKIIGRNRTYIVDVDIGGTFTDAVVCAQGRPETFKAETTPHDMSLCIKQVIEKALAIFDEADIPTFLGKTDIIRLSTSRGTSWGTSASIYNVVHNLN